MSNKHENVIHAMADKLLDYFEGSGAVNYIEQTFGCNDDPSKSFVVTMQKVEGLTPCQKLAATEQRIKTLEEYVKRSQDENERLVKLLNRDQRAKEHLELILSISDSGE